METAKKTRAQGDGGPNVEKVASKTCWPCRELLCSTTLTAPLSRILLCHSAPDRCSITVVASRTEAERGGSQSISYCREPVGSENEREKTGGSSLYEMNVVVFC